jgi:hypothetical protein
MHSPRLLVIAALSAAVALVSAGPATAAPRSAALTVGYDVSYPQCGGRLPRDPAFGIVGVSDGLAYGQNPCLAEQYAWALRAPVAPAFYMNTGNPGTGTTRTDWYRQDGPEACSEANEPGCAYNYGWFAAEAAFEFAASQSNLAAATNADWWLDVETANSWSSDAALNVVDIQGSIDFLTSKVTTVGIYSTGYQWGQITGGAQLGATTPNWVAGALNANEAPALCSPSGFSGGAVRYVQYVTGGLDANYACP